MINVALVHDSFLQSGSAERVVDVLHEMFPDAPIYTTVLRREMLSPRLADADIRPSWLQSLTALGVPPDLLMPLFPSAISSLDLSEFDLVISNSTAFAGNAQPREDACHICYCHAPFSPAWDASHFLDQPQLSATARSRLRPMLEKLLLRDVTTKKRVRQYLANSSSGAERIHAAYHLDAEVIPVPVNVTRLGVGAARADFHVIVSPLIPEKRIDLAIQAFNGLGRRLVILGEGPEAVTLKRMAGPTVSLLGRLPDSNVARYLSEARALVIPGVEDFGITALEANACGRPVIAFGAGSALDTVIDGTTGVQFDDATSDALAAAVLRAEAIEWSAPTLRAHAEQFAEEHFKVRMGAAIDRVLERFGRDRCLSQLRTMDLRRTPRSERAQRAGATRELSRDVR